ncbi:GNAT family N-acetyltransferase [Saccharothrix australiensis]|uniref:Ribosomal protein S18 acetylase RimI-like enzyme n=1 Tax=Saccharothrix australiensis TaxID=2072 RepID=A0A495W7C3_9PSEU|nr:GNAT family N-acetyltransferase [Saccharothrix australiensis]RKT57379.1 ribosomal protein S18 acetylase RimI-like enzyme [Saccharothrix australiensis]
MTVDTVEARRVHWDDPATAPLKAELTHEYVSRYGDGAREELTRYDAALFAPPDGTLLLLLVDGRAVAGGAFKRRDAHTAELKRIWTRSGHRRQGLGRRVVAELERAAVELGYRRIYLTTGPKQPEAKGLYLATGYTPLFDVTADPLTIGLLAFEKHLERSEGAYLPAHRRNSA